jgi:IS605 OrfB family transposase
MRRIEQIEELRKRFQSLNQTQRREIGGKPPIRRDDSIPDCCPDLLDKLDNIKTQRVNQTAHMILAKALGLRLAPPPADKRQLRASRDVHGQYVKAREPVDFIVIEDLSRYRSSQGRAPRENSRLMKWCHRAVRDKLREICEPFGIPVVETPAAYSSRFCSRSGVAGFRAVEVGPGFEREFPWVMLKDKSKDGQPTAEAKWVQELIRQVTGLNEGRDGKPSRTLLAPQTGGPLFVPIVDKANGADIQPAIVQADINAAINLGLRAVADPRLWSIHPRCRTQRQGEEVRSREKRKFGEKGQPLAIHRADGVKGGDTRNPNFFADNSGSLACWERATIGDQPLLSGRCLWSEVKKQQWQCCAEINARRMKKWQDNLLM